MKTIMLGLATLALASCGDVADEITSIVYGRNFSPTNLEARVVNRTNVRLTWTPVEGATSYNIEVFANDIRIYGLNKGENDADRINTLNAEGWESKNWFVSSGANALTDDIIDGLFVVKPSTHCVWPIWKCFIDASNNMINNDGNLGQLSD